VTDAWFDPRALRDGQYATDANLAARQSIYAYQRPRTDLPALVLDRAALRGDETVADVGCGNGRYLAALSARGHRGPVVGIDLSVDVELVVVLGVGVALHGRGPRVPSPQRRDEKAGARRDRQEKSSISMVGAARYSFSCGSFGGPRRRCRPSARPRRASL